MEETLENSTDSITPEVLSVAPETKKVRKPLSEQALEKLKIAREKAAESNRAKKVERDLKKKQDDELLQQTLQQTRDPIVVVEQSDSDPDELTGPPGVIFVRRKRPKSEPVKSNEQIAQEAAYLRMFGPQ